MLYLRRSRFLHHNVPFHIFLALAEGGNRMPTAPALHKKSWKVIDRPFYVGVTCQPQIVVKRFEFSSLKDPSP